MAGARVLIVLTTVAIWQWRRMPYLAVGWFWFLGTLVPVIGLVQIGRQALADRYTYIPSIGLWLAVVWGIEEMDGEMARPGSADARIRIAGVALAACHVVLTVRQIGYWKDSEALFSHGIEVNRRDWVNSAYLAAEFQREVKEDKALEFHQQSLDINPYRSRVRWQLATFLLERHRLNEALAQFQQGLNLDPNDLDLRRGCAVALQDLGRLDEAIGQFDQVVKTKPDDADSYSNLGNCYGMKGRTDDAIRCFEQAVKLKPELAENHRDLGVGLVNAGR